MPITVQKAGQAAVKAAAAAAKSSPPLSAATVSQVVNRSVSVAEAPYVTPARESTKVSLMPWRGWFQRWLKETIGEKRFQQFRETFFFMPDDIYSELGQIQQSVKVPISATDPTITRMYRYPAPGSEGPPKLPQWEEDEDPFDSGFYKKDTVRRYLTAEYGNPHVERMKLFFMDQDDPAVKEEIARLERGPESSKGNGGVFATGPTDFDPTGLRASMSATWKAMNESLDANMPDHLPTPIWVGREAEEAKHYIDRGIPPPFGGFYEPLVTPIEQRVATWTVDKVIYTRG